VKIIQVPPCDLTIFREKKYIGEDCEILNLAIPKYCRFLVEIRT